MAPGWPSARATSFASTCQMKVKPLWKRPIAASGGYWRSRSHGMPQWRSFIIFYHGFIEKAPKYQSLSIQKGKSSKPHVYPCVGAKQFSSFDGVIWCLVGGLEHFLFLHILGINRSQQTFIYFFRGVGRKTTNQMCLIISTYISRNHIMVETISIEYIYIFLWYFYISYPLHPLHPVAFFG